MKEKKEEIGSDQILIKFSTFYYGNELSKVDTVASVTIDSFDRKILCDPLATIKFSLCDRRSREANSLRAGKYLQEADIVG